MLVNKTSHKFTGKQGQKVDKTKCGHNHKIILFEIPLVCGGGEITNWSKTDEIKKVFRA